MSNTLNTYAPLRSAWRGSLGASGSQFDWFLVNMVDPTSLEMVLDEIKRGVTGKVVLDERFVALKGTVKIVVPDVTKAAIGAAMPWNAGSGGATGPWGLTPSQNATMYQYASLLTLHPNAASDTTLDLNFCKAVPKTIYNLKRDGEKDDLWEISFSIYPDHTRLFAGTSLSYGWVGATDPIA